jgi:hypothetical protein
MEIRTSSAAPTDMAWSAIDNDSYDGAPDAGHVAHFIGYGPTEVEAITDLQMLFQEEQEFQDDLYDKHRNEERT